MTRSRVRSHEPKTRLGSFRRIRVAAGTLELGPIWCAVCETDFEMADPD
jgi:hypothetical protein